MKNYDYWKDFFSTGKIDDYLMYIACAREDVIDEAGLPAFKEEGDYRAGINCRDGNGSIGHAGW